MPKISDVIRDHAEKAAANAQAEALKATLQRQLDAMGGVCTTTRRSLDASYQTLAAKLPEGKVFVMPDGQLVTRLDGQIRLFPPGNADLDA